MEQIASRQNAWIKLVNRLKLKKYRDQERLFLAEGAKFLDFGHRIRAAFCGESLCLSDARTKRLESLADRIFTVPDAIYARISSLENAYGPLLVYPYLDIPEENSPLSDFCVVLDGVGDPGNLGTILRTLDATGFEDVLLSEDCVDIYNEKVIRSTMGSIFRIRFRRMDRASIAETLKSKGYKLMATAISPEAVDYDEVDYSGKVALILGNEGSGVSEELLQSADIRVKIPMYGQAESLNVAVACGVLLYRARACINGKLRNADR
ncbi:MAG: RNA methyltransferase [Fusobacteriaceae bacterium]|jgi:TrmH family RNA methyltransferase|nr:RNA methyltransferase [Fusobacteriaceae bacterium]